MASKPEKLRATLLELGLPPEYMEAAIPDIIDTQERLALSMEEFAKKRLARSLALSQDMHAIQLIEALTDTIVQQQGVLELAMQGKDIHDTLATIKAKLTSLISEEEEEPMTVKKLQSTTQRLARLKKPDRDKT